MASEELYRQTSRGLTNFLGDEGEEQVRASYRVNYERLVALKNKYDPSNTFHFNQNIQPTRTLSSNETRGKQKASCGRR
jgi:hypothetical protein